MGEKWDLQGICIGLALDLENSSFEIQNIAFTEI
jgi:hypothetical protein